MAKFSITESAINEENKMTENIKEFITNKNYDEITASTVEWSVFKNLSSLRRNLFLWYDFNSNSTLLEIGAGFGSLTGLFCERCKDVISVEKNVNCAKAIYERYRNIDNLNVIAGETTDINFSCQFDYIVIVEELEKIAEGSSDKTIYIEYLMKIKKLLKPNGKLLIVVDNRYSIRNFCGATRETYERPFDSINGNHFKENKKVLFSRNELVEILEEVGISYNKFYYPLPDYLFTQMIFTDDYLPKANVIERLVPYYIDRNTLVADEKKLYKDIIDNGAFSFMANSFLIECCNQNNFCNVIYSAISADRPKKDCFITSIYKNKIVKKIPVFSEGEKETQNIVLSMKELKERGISVVPNSIKNGFIEMPYMECPLLSDYMYKTLFEDTTKFINIFEHIYEIVLKSSDLVEDNMNILANEITADLDWGPILKKCYIELIQLNCFCDKGEYIFFDQEFVRENYPAKYVLFRCIYYFYLFYPEAENYVPKKDVIDIFSLNELWNVFLTEEQKFQERIHRYKENNYLINHNGANVERINHNITALKNGTFEYNYSLDKKMLKIREIEIELLKKFIQVCDKYSLRYFAFAGTLLGVVRHKGFIPWDDDIDLAMPREDFDKLSEIANMEFQDKYQLQTLFNDPENFNGGFSRLRNCNTTGISIYDIGHNCCNGIFIDIFPLDSYTSDYDKQYEKDGIIKKYHNLLFAKLYGKYDKPENIDFEEWHEIILESEKYTRDELNTKLYNGFTMYNSYDTKYLMAFSDIYKRPFEKQLFDSQVFMDFEGIKIAVPSGYNRYLEINYGADYMTLPPENQRVPNHKIFFDVNKPYKYYNNIFSNLFEKLDGKKIILFGAGSMFEHYMNKFGSKYKPIFIVDNDVRKWGITKKGCMIRKPKDILTLDDKDRRVIICSAYYKEIMKQLDDMGIKDYKVYIQNPKWILDNN